MGKFGKFLTLPPLEHADVLNGWSLTKSTSFKMSTIAIWLEIVLWLTLPLQIGFFCHDRKIWLWAAPRRHSLICSSGTLILAFFLCEPLYLLYGSWLLGKLMHNEWNQLRLIWWKNLQCFTIYTKSLVNATFGPRTNLC